LFGSKDDTCLVNVRYHVRFTVAADLPKGGATSQAHLGVGGATYYLPAPNGTQTDCSVATISTNWEAQVSHRDSVAVGYWVGSVGSTGWQQNWGVSSPKVEITDVEILDVTVDDGEATCPTCVGEFGTETGSVGSAATVFQTGPTAYGRLRNRLHVYEQLAGPLLSSPQSLYLLAGSIGDLEVITNTTGANVLRQVKSPLGLVDIVATNDCNYTITFYGTSSIGSKVGGLYTLTNAVALRSYQVLNPSGSTNNPNCIQFIENRSGSLITNQYDWLSASNLWQYLRGNGAHLEKRQFSTNSGICSETHTVHNPSSTNTVIRKTLQKRQNFAWGNSMIESTADPDGAQLKTTYNYFTNRSDYGYGKLQQVNYAYGGWQIVNYDTQGRILRVYSSFGNQTATTNASLCRKVEYDYTPIAGSSDPGVYRPNLPRREIDYVLGQEVGRKYWVYTKAQKQEIVCTAAGAAWNDANNLVTITKRVASGVFKDELASVKNPDGTVTLYQYATNSTSKTTTVLSGQADNTGTNVVDGTMTVTVVGLAGQLLSNQVYDIASGLLLDQQIYSNFDAQQRPQTVTFLDNSTQVTVYGCCGPESFTDRDGTVTSYGYDVLRRKTSETVNGVSTLYGFDGANRVISVVRQGSDATQMLQHGYTYDLAGRLVAETNAVGVVTTYSETVNFGTGQTTRTTTYAFGTPDQCTRVEVYASDGTLMSVSGTAVNPVRYAYGVEQDGGSGPYLLFKQEIKLDANGTDTSEWIKTYTDTAGRAYKTVYAASSGLPNNQSSFNTLGQLSKQVDPDGVTTLFAYNAKGELQDSVLDTDRNGAIDLGGLDRVTRTIRDVVYNSTYGWNVQRTRTLVFPNNNDGTTTNETSRVERSTDGSRTWSTSFGLVSSSQAVYNRAAATRTETATAPDGSYVIKIYTNGRLTSTTQYAYGGTQLGQTTYTYDASGRRATATDARNGTTSYTYDDADRVLSEKLGGVKKLGGVSPAFPQICERICDSPGLTPSPLSGTYTVSADCATPNRDAEFVVEVAGQKLPGTAPQTGNWETFRTAELGQVHVQHAGEQLAAIRPRDAEHWKAINLRSLVLKKTD
jgi:YD repeat-containing protein